MWILEKLERNSIYVSNLHEKKRRSYAIVRDPLADISQDYNLTYNGKGFVIDHSHDVPEIEFPSVEKLKKYYEFVESILNGDLDLNTLIEMVKNEKKKENKLLNKYDEEFILQMIPYEDIKIIDFINKFENPNKVVDTLAILEKKGKITASSQGYMRKV